MDVQPLLNSDLVLPDLDTVSLQEPDPSPSKWSRFKVFVPKIIQATGSFLTFTAATVCKVWNYRVWNHPAIDTATSIGMGCSIQVFGFSFLSKKQKEEYTDFEARWMLEAFEITSQTLLNLPQSALQNPKILDTFSTAFAIQGAAALTNDLRTIGTIRISQEGLLIEEKESLSKVLIPMIEGSTQNLKAFIGTQMTKTAVAVSLVTVGKLVPQVAFIEGLGWIVGGHVLGTFLMHATAKALQRAQNQFKPVYDAENIDVAPAIPLSIKFLRIAPQGLISIKMVFSGIFFALGKPWSVATLGALEGIGKTYSQIKLEQDPIHIGKTFVMNKTVCRSAITVENVAKTVLLLGADTYLIYGIIVTPLPAKLALGSFMLSTLASYLLTKGICRSFTQTQKKEFINSLFFYFIYYPDYLRQLFLYVRQQQILNDEQLDSDDPKSLTLAILAYLSFGLAWGNYRAIQSSDYRPPKPQTTSPLAQALLGHTIYKLFQGQF